MPADGMFAAVTPAGISASSRVIGRRKKFTPLHHDMTMKNRSFAEEK
jgi:hypothetical protein